MALSFATYLGSMDHSPSEQLGDLDDWHTTALLLSEAAQHWALAQKIAQRLQMRDGLIRKWSSNPAYRKSGKFEAALLENLDKSGTYVRVISAQGRTIRHCFDQMVAQLGLSGLVEKTTRNEKLYLKFGPYRRVIVPNNETATDPVYFEVIEQQALPLIFICHFVLRMHQQLLPVIRRRQPEIEWIDWQLMPNKFPGDITGPMASLFHAIMSGAAHQRLVAGNIRIITFNKSRDDVGSSLADNIAGWAAEKLIRNQPMNPALKGTGDAFDWEIWRSET
jgi:hypothetical protein